MLPAPCNPEQAASPAAYKPVNQRDQLPTTARPFSLTAIPPIVISARHSIAIVCLLISIPVRLLTMRIVASHHTTLSLSSLASRTGCEAAATAEQSEFKSPSPTSNSLPLAS